MSGILFFNFATCEPLKTTQKLDAFENSHSLCGTIFQKFSTGGVWILKVHHLIFLPNKIRLNLRNTFVMSRNKHISKKTSCFSRKRSKNKVKPNEFERRILKLSCYACSDNPKCRHAFSMFRNASSQNKFRFNLLRCMTKTPDATLQ